LYEPPTLCEPLRRPARAERSAVPTSDKVEPLTHANSCWYWHSPRELLRAILMLDDTPHSIALGTAVGMFIGITPTPGLQMLLVILLAIAVRRLFRFNRTAALVAVYFSNPITAVPICWVNYKVGTLFFPGDLTRAELARIIEYRGFAEWWHSLTTLFVEIGPPLILGSVIIGFVAGIATYPAMLWLLKSVRSCRPPSA
jgi:hypothetical protein